METIHVSAGEYKTVQLLLTCAKRGETSGILEMMRQGSRIFIRLTVWNIHAEQNISWLPEVEVMSCFTSDGPAHSKPSSCQCF